MLAQNEDHLLHQFGRLLKAFIFFLCSFAGSGCAIHYYDPETGTEHIWGIGHMKMKVADPNEGVRAIISGTNTIGMAAGSTSSERYLSIGWQQLSRFRVLGADSSVRLEWPSSDYFSVRIGSTFPTDPADSKDIKYSQ